MFNINLGNAKVNGHMPAMATKRPGNGNVRKAVVTSHADPSVPPQPNSLSAANGPLKFADRLKVLLNAGPEAGGDMVGVSDDSLSIKDDPYAFNEPETAVLHQYQNTGAASKANHRPMAKVVQKRSGSGSGEPTGLNMTRLFPAITTNTGHSFFSPQSPQSTTNLTHSNAKTTLASLLESSLLADDTVPKSSSELERAFSFTSKELNCFPNLTSPQPQEQVIATTPIINTCKVSPLTHGSPVTPQRESNKLAALFSPTYPNSIRADTKGRSLSKVGRVNSRDGKNTVRISQSDRRASLSSFEKSKEAIKSASLDGNLALRKQDDDEYSKITVNRLQTKIARSRVTGKHKKVDSVKVSTEIPQRRHSLNDITPASRKERSLLEEQLVIQKAAKIVKREPVSASPPPLPPPPPVPAATTRVPGSITLTTSAARTSHNASPNPPRGSAPSRQSKAQATYYSPKSSKSQAGVTLNKQIPPKNGAYNARSSSLSRQPSPWPSYLLGRTNQPNRAQKRPRVKLEMPETSIKHEALQRLQPLAKSASFVIPPTIVETESEDSDLDEGLVYQKHWFSGWREAGSGLVGEERREGRLSQLRAELRRKLRQVLASRRDPALSPLPACIMDSALTKPSKTAELLRPKQKNRRVGRSKLSMLVERKCVYTNPEGEACTATALPCARHCTRHIMYNVDQLLFEHCTAKFADNTQCCVPVFDFCHELPLCLEHARKRDNYNRMCQESKPKKPRRKPKPSAMTRSSKRSKKKKKQKQKQRVSRSQSLPAGCIATLDSDHFEASLGAEISSSPCGSAEIYVTDDAFVRLHEPEQDIHSVAIKVENIHDVGAVDVGVEEVLDLPLDATDLAEQASRLLEEHDLNNVLNQIPADAFNDLFIEDKNGEPTREETEELERALAAVDKDVKSLERMSQNHILLEDLNAKGLSKLSPGAQELLPGASVLDPSTPAAQVFLDIEKLSQAPVLFDDKLSNAHGLLENLLDDQALVQTLTAQLPELPAGTNCLSSGGVVPVYYHNGYSVGGSGMPSHNISLYQTLQPAQNMAATVLHTQTDLHS